VGKEWRRHSQARTITSGVILYEWRSSPGTRSLPQRRVGSSTWSSQIKRSNAKFLTDKSSVLGRRPHWQTCYPSASSSPVVGSPQMPTMDRVRQFPKPNVVLAHRYADADCSLEARQQRLLLSVPVRKRSFTVVPEEDLAPVFDRSRCNHSHASKRQVLWDLNRPESGGIHKPSPIV